MTLNQKQHLFARLLSVFIRDLTSRGYEVVIGEVFRPKETAKIYAEQGKGIANSLHTICLAADLNLFQNGKYLTNSEEYLEAGKVWESYSMPTYKCCWGGRFKNQDGNHFSIEHNGVR